jgi:hypothetical protein
MGFQFDWGWDFNWTFLTSPTNATFWALLVLNVGAVFRLARVISKDTILDRPRTHITENYHGMLPTLLICMWCLGFWFSLVAVFFTAWQTTHDLWLIVAGVCTFSAIVGILGERT